MASSSTFLLQGLRRGWSLAVLLFAMIECGSIRAANPQAPAGTPPMPMASSVAKATPPDTRTVALAFLQRCADGDMDGAYAHWAIPNYIQHNPDIPDGVAGHRAFFAQVEHQYGQVGGWANVTDMLLVDGDLFASFHHVYRSPQDAGRMFVDIWRVKEGRIVEHWDVIQPIPATKANSNGVACGVGEDYKSARAIQDGPGEPACGRPDPNVSRAESLRVLEGYTRDLDNGDVSEAVHRWFAPGYRQHSPGMADGIDGAIAYLQHAHGRAAKVHAKAVSPLRIVAEGDIVLVHHLVQYPGAAQPSANVDIFRIAQGRISEHWDIKQPVPATTRSGHPMW